MRNMKFHDWMNLIAAVGVLAGLILVAVELRQNNNLALAETTRALWYADSDIDMFAIENGILPLFRKSVEQPLDLSDDEIDRFSCARAMGCANVTRQQMQKHR